MNACMIISFADFALLVLLRRAEISVPHVWGALKDGLIPQFKILVDILICSHFLPSGVEQFTTALLLRSRNCESTYSPDKQFFISCSPNVYGNQYAGHTVLKC